MADKAVFLDRDDTIIEDPGYLSDPADVKLLPGADLAIKSLRQAGYKVIVVTNQSGIARGLLTEQRLEEIHDELRRQLDERGASVDAIYFCPYLPDAPIDKYAVDSDLRKPKPGMLLKAAEEMDLDLHNSWAIGDSPRDVEAGRRAGCRTVRIRNPRRSGSTEGHEDPILADFTVRNLVDAARIVLREGDREPPEQPVEHTVEQTASNQPAPAGTDEPQTPQPPAQKAPNEPAPRPAEHETFSGQSKPADEEWSPRTGSQAADVSTMTDSAVRREILRHVRQFVRSREAEEFSLSKLFAGILQVLVFMPLLLCVWKMLGGEEEFTQAAVWALLAILLQVMALTFFMMHRVR
ncbi:MAG: HAD-IIIA family hydrolase [Phycisphaerae bacterium]